MKLEVAARMLNDSNRDTTFITLPNRQSFSILLAPSIPVLIWCSTGFSLLFLVGCSWLLVGLTPYSRDLSKQPEFWGGYNLGSTYELLTDVFIVRNTVDPRTPLLAPPRAVPRLGLLLYNMPESISEWESDPKLWANIKGAVRQGTPLRVVRILEEGSTAGRPYPPEIHQYAEVLDGQFQGQILDVRLLSLPIKQDTAGLRLLRPDDRLLKAVP